MDINYMKMTMRLEGRLHACYTHVGLSTNLATDFVHSLVELALYVHIYG